MTVEDAADTPRVVIRGRVVLPGHVIEDGIVLVTGQRIEWVGDEAVCPPYLLGVAAESVPAELGAVVLPGLVDLHDHGGGGVGFPDARSLDEVRTAAFEHLTHGTTSLIASLVTADPQTLLTQTSLLADAADAGILAGIHLEGPFLAAERRGAHDRAKLQPGDASLVRLLAETARGHLATMTVAPELPGVRGPGGVLEALARAGALPSFGHTAASPREVGDAVAEARMALSAAGARSARPTVTHLFNGMPPLHHRDPGPIAACLAAAARGEAVVELIADGVHLHSDLVRAVFDLLGPDAIALVTDAMAATGMGDGEYPLGSMRVRVTGGVARTVEDGAIAGGTAHLLDVVRATVAAGVELHAAVRSASSTPAAVLGRGDVGVLQAGRRADLVVTDGELRVISVMRAGQWVVSSAPGRAHGPSPGPVAPA